MKDFMIIKNGFVIDIIQAKNYNSALKKIKKNFNDEVRIKEYFSYKDDKSFNEDMQKIERGY